MCQFLKIVPHHNFKPSLVIIMNDGDQYFKKKIIFMFIFIVPHVNTWMIINDIMGAFIMELHSS
jgi:hypothetical protein